MAGKGIITMTQEELRRLHIIRQVLDKKLKQTEAAEKVGLSYRQTKRITKRIRKEGDGGIIHRLRGQSSKRKIAAKTRDRVLTLCRGKYKGFGSTLATEKLFEIEKIKLSKETLRNWLIEEGLWQRRRKHKKHRRWRERKHYFGEMVQMDGSHHPWFGSEESKCVLMGYIDDATGKKCGWFYKYEGTLPALDSLKRYIKKHGIPHSIYLDRHSTYKSPKKPTIEDQLNNRESLSQFEKAAKELGIRIIHANSAPAKGRIERSFRTDQDRLVKEMRLRGISTIKEANKFLKSYWSKHNERFAVKPVKESNLHRPVPEGVDLDAILRKKTEHVLRKDFTIAHDKKLYQILDNVSAKKVTVEERIDSRMLITYKSQSLKYKTITQRPKKQEKAKKIVAFKTKKAWTPPTSHPWKRPMYERRYGHTNPYLQKEKADQKEKELLLTKT